MGGAWRRSGGGRRRALLVVVLLWATVLAGCGDDDGGDGAASTTSTVGTEAEPGATGDVRVANLNLLHGLPIGSCPEETDGCQAAARLDAVWSFVEDADCPDVLTFQEVGPTQQELIPATLDDVCGGVYEVVSATGSLPVEVWVLTSLPVLGTVSTPLAGLSRQALMATVESDIGPVEVITTHFVADIDDGLCGDGLCPSELCPDELTAGECNAIEVLDFVERAADPATPTVLTGDLNDPIDGPRVTRLLDAGFVDTWALAGNAECDPATPEACTSGQGGDGPYDGLDVVANTRSSRIDFILVQAPDDCALDGTTAAGFADEPFPPAVDGVVWASDHTGVQATITCTP